MEQKINIAELLKDCPQGMELDCAMFENLEFDRIEKDDGSGKYYIICRVKTKIGYNVHTFTEHGCYSSNNYAKCVIFPKGKTTWEEFHRPFKDGDILVYKDKYKVKYTFIYKRRIDMHYLLQYCGWFSEKPYLSEQFNVKERKPLYENDDIKFATEEEKEKLFQAIKDNGYNWNSETKTLEELVKPKFKVGDKIKHKYEKFRDERTITAYGKSGYWTSINDWIDYENQDDWKLVPNKFDITKLKPFKSEVLIRNTKIQKWVPAFWGYKTDEGYVTTFGTCIYCIPYEGNENLLNTNNDCIDYYKTWEE